MSEAGWSQGESTCAPVVITHLFLIIAIKPPAMLQDDSPALSSTVCQTVRFQLVPAVPSAHDPWLATLFIYLLSMHICVL